MSVNQYLGITSLYKTNGVKVRVHVSATHESNFRESDPTLVESTFWISNRRGKKIGSITVEAGPQETEITTADNNTFSLGKNKIPMGRLFIEFAFVSFFKAGSKALSVYSGGRYTPHWYYFSQGFKRVDHEENEQKDWRFDGAENIYQKIECGKELSKTEVDLYNSEKTKLANALGISEETLSFEDICKIKNIDLEMERIFKHALSQKKRAAYEPLPWMRMQMCSQGIERGKQLLLASELDHDRKVISNLEVELLEDYAKRSPPKKIVELVCAYAYA